MLIELGYGPSGTPPTPTVGAPALFHVHLAVEEADSSADLLDPIGAQSLFFIGTVHSITALEAAIGRSDIKGNVEAQKILSRLRGAASDDASSHLITADQIDATREFVREYLAHVRTNGDEAIGVVESSPTARRTGLLASWASEPEPVELASSGSASVWIEGLELILRHDDDTETISDICSFQLGIDGGVITDGAGNAHALGEDATTVLGDLTAGATAWRKRPVPGVLVWANVLAGLEATLDALPDRQQPAMVRIGPSTD